MNYGNNGDDYDPILPHKTPYDFNNRIMMSAIISLTFVITVVLVLHIYARCSMRNRQRMSRQREIAALRQLSPVIRTSELSTNIGLDQTVIDLLPIFVFKKPEYDQIDDECAVCLSMLEEEDTARLLPNCNHVFHVDCIDKWLRNQSTCPICRTEATPMVQKSPRPPPPVQVNSVPLETPQPPALAEVLVESNGGRETATNVGCGCAEGSGSSSNPPPEGGGKRVGGGSSSFRLGSSFRKMISRDISSSSRIQDCREDHDMEDLERQ